MLNFIWNPVAGKGKAIRYRAEAERLLTAAGIPYRFHATEKKGDGAKLARRLYDEGERTFIAAGGDGTIHEVLNGLPETKDVCFGVLPCGSGNDFCRGIGIPSDAEDAIRLIMEGDAKPTDYMVCSGIRSLNVLGTGIDVDILRYVSKCRVLKGSAAYFASLLRALVNFGLYGFSAEYNGKKTRHDAMIICACNGRYIGGGIPICPGASCDDGRIELVLAENVRKPQIPGALVKLMQGKLLDLSFARHEFTERIRVELDKPGTVQIDGELYEGLPFDVSVVPGGIRVYRS